MVCLKQRIDFQWTFWSGKFIQENCTKKSVVRLFVCFICNLVQWAPSHRAVEKSCGLNSMCEKIHKWKNSCEQFHACNIPHQSLRQKYESFTWPFFCLKDESSPKTKKREHTRPFFCLKDESSPKTKRREHMRPNFYLKGESSLKTKRREHASHKLLVGLQGYDYYGNLKLTKTK